MRIVLGLSLVLLTAFAAIQWLVDRTYGAHTQIVDHAQFQIASALTAITNVSVLSPDGEEMRSNRTVILDAGKIISITE